MTFSRPSSFTGTLWVALSGTLYGVLGYFGTLLLQDGFSIPNMLFWRFFIAFLYMLATSLLFQRTILKKIRIDKTFLKMLFFSILAYGGSSAFYFWASASIGTGIAMVVFFAYPLFVTLFTWFFTDWKFNVHAVSSLAIVIIGLVLLKGHGSETLSWQGITLALIAALSYAIYIYGSMHSTRSINTGLQTLVVCAGNAVFYCLLAYKDHSLTLPLFAHSWSLMLGLGIVATAIPIQLLLEGLKQVSPIKASILSVLEPVVTVLMGLAFLHETVGALQMIGIVVVLLGAIIIQFEKEPNHVYE